MGKIVFTLTARECLPEWIVQKSVHAEALDVLLDKKIVTDDQGVYNSIQACKTYYAVSKTKDCCKHYQTFCSVVGHLNVALKKIGVGLYRSSSNINGNPFNMEPFLLDRAK